VSVGFLQTHVAGIHFGRILQGAQGEIALASFVRSLGDTRLHGAVVRIEARGAFE